MKEDYFIKKIIFPTENNIVILTKNRSLNNELGTVVSNSKDNIVHSDEFLNDIILNKNNRIIYLNDYNKPK